MVAHILKKYKFHWCSIGFKPLDLKAGSREDHPSALKHCKIKNVCHFGTHAKNSMNKTHLNAPPKKGRPKRCHVSEFMS